MNVGKINQLEVIKILDFGAYLDGGRLGEILVPKRYLPANCQVGDTLEVFVYLDSEDRIIATTQRPLAQVGEFAYLKVVSVNQFGAYLDWGLAKDLFVPFREQKQTLIEHRSYVVYVYIDQDSNRIAASAKIDKFLDKTQPTYEVGQTVSLLIAQRTDLGYKAIINHQHWGVVYENEVFGMLSIGQQCTGYIKQVREDLKIDLTLQPIGYQKVNDASVLLYEKLKQAGGFLKITDKSPSDQIYALFGISKKTYKKAVGDLYKKRLIALINDGIRLIDATE